MTKYIVLSVNDNVDYLYFTPLTCWAWRKMGWEPVLFYQRAPHRADPTTELEYLVFNKGDILPVSLGKIEGYRSDTITQISRLYAGCLMLREDDYLMTGDIDMIPLSDYWEPDVTKPTVWGHDLTGFRHFPICYIGAQVKQWREFMKLEGTDYQYHIQKDLMELPQAKSPDFYTYWFTDQDLVTERLKQYGTSRIDFINRGQGKHGFARGRVDKGDGGWVLNQPELIDAHLMQQTHHKEEKIRKTMDLLHHVWPNEDWKWFLEYTKEFKKLAC